MSDDRISPATVNELAATVGISIAEADRARIAALMASIRAAVMRRADTLPMIAACAWVRPR
ncbi:hypothetical protein ACVWWG_006276 [Bradyrhizobium sp. LB7.2]